MPTDAALTGMHLARVTVSVDARVPTGQTNAYVVGETDALLVDPPAAHDDLDVAIDLVDVGHIAVTHTHPDHVGGVAHYAEETGATVWVRRGRESQFEVMTGISPDRTFAEGTALETGDGFDHGTRRARSRLGPRRLRRRRRRRTGRGPPE